MLVKSNCVSNVTSGGNPCCRCGDIVMLCTSTSLSLSVANGTTPCWPSFRGLFVVSYFLKLLLLPSLKCMAQPCLPPCGFLLIPPEVNQPLTSWCPPCSTASQPMISLFAGLFSFLAAASSASSPLSQFAATSPAPYAPPLLSLPLYIARPQPSMLAFQPSELFRPLRLS